MFFVCHRDIIKFVFGIIVPNPLPWEILLSLFLIYISFSNKVFLKIKSLKKKKKTILPIFVSDLSSPFPPAGQSPDGASVGPPSQQGRPTAGRGLLASFFHLSVSIFFCVKALFLLNDQNCIFFVCVKAVFLLNDQNSIFFVCVKALYFV